MERSLPSDRASPDAAHHHAARDAGRARTGWVCCASRYTRTQLRNLVRAALDEDEAFNDLTTIATVVSDRHARGRARRARDRASLCGVPLAVEAFRQLDPKVTIRVDVEDGARARRRDADVLYLTGHARALLSAPSASRSTSCSGSRGSRRSRRSTWTR